MGDGRRAHDARGPPHAVPADSIMAPEPMECRVRLRVKSWLLNVAAIPPMRRCGGRRAGGEFDCCMSPSYRRYGVAEGCYGHRERCTCLGVDVQTSCGVGGARGPICVLRCYLARSVESSRCIQHCRPRRRHERITAPSDEVTSHAGMPPP